MQFQVPQNVTMEDRIVGSLSMVQFVILLVGGFAAFFVFTAESLPLWVARGIGILIGIVTIVIALGKFNDQPMYRFFRYMFAFLFTPKTRVWHKGGREVPLIKAAPKGADGSNRANAKSVSKEDFARLAAVVDSRGQIGNIPERNSKEG